MKKYIQLIVLCVVFSLCGCEKHDDVILQKNISIIECDIMGLTANIRIAVSGPQIEGVKYGICYSSINNTPNIRDQFVMWNTATSGVISNLQKKTTYNFRPFYTDGDEYVYGETIRRTTTERLSGEIKISECTIDGLTAKISLEYTGTQYEGTKFGVCYSSTNYSPTIKDSYVVWNTAKSGVISSLTRKTTYYFRPYVTDGVDYIYGNIVTQATGANQPEGALEGEFSVSSSRKVFFSRGNLYYSYWTSSKYFGIYYLQYQRESISENEGIGKTNYTNDLFGYGTSGYSYSPISYELVASKYARFNISNTYYDWGVYNAMFNGGEKSGIWRTLTSTEWRYLFNSRSSASSKYSLATVNNVPGMVILPDLWILPSSCRFTPHATYYTTNTYSLTTWKDMENAGAVFLPACGQRYGTSVEDYNVAGTYWSSSWDEGGTGTNGKTYSAQPLYLYFSESAFWPNAVQSGTNSNYNSYGRSVRLVTDVK